MPCCISVACSLFKLPGILSVRHVAICLNLWWPSNTFEFLSALAVVSKAAMTIPPDTGYRIQDLTP